MRYYGTVIRPPSEADSLILQVTYGCSRNTCDFCGSYVDKPFRVRPFREVVEDVTGLPQWAKDQIRRVFLADGDAVVLPYRRMLEVLDLLREELPRLERVSAYANARVLLRKSEEQLAELRARGLTLLYLGLESGDDVTLRDVNKDATVAEQIEACRRAKAAGMKLSVTAILGLGQEARSLVHAHATAEAFSAIDPEYIGILSLLVRPGTRMEERVRAGEFVIPGPFALFKELREMLAGIEVTDSLFRCNHASNYLPLGGRLPNDKKALLSALDQVLAMPERVRLRPEEWRLL